MGKGLDKTVKEVGFVGGAGPVRDHKGPVGGGGVCESRRGYTGKKVGLMGEGRDCWGGVAMVG